MCCSPALSLLRLDAWLSRFWRCFVVHSFGLARISQTHGAQQIQQKHAQQEKGRKDEAALRFGERKRGLPRWPEELAFSFLDLSDLGALCLTSKLNCDNIARFLKQTKHIASGDALAAQQRGWQLAALRIAAEHCRELKRASISRLTDGGWEIAQPLLASLVHNNRSKLTSFNANNSFGNALLDEVLRRCPFLESLFLNQPAPADFAARLCSLRALRSITVQSLSALRNMEPSMLPSLTSVSVTRWHREDMDVLEFAKFSKLVSPSTSTGSSFLRTWQCGSLGACRNLLASNR